MFVWSRTNPTTKPIASAAPKLKGLSKSKPVTAADEAETAKLSRPTGVAFKRTPNFGGFDPVEPESKAKTVAKVAKSPTASDGPTVTATGFSFGTPKVSSESKPAAGKFGFGTASLAGSPSATSSMAKAGGFKFGQAVVATAPEEGDKSDKGAIKAETGKMPATSNLFGKAAVSAPSTSKPTPQFGKAAVSTPSTSPKFGTAASTGEIGAEHLPRLAHDMM